jgi:HPt (histidine-containing phosphotransfer) domain-containing protein
LTGTQESDTAAQRMHLNPAVSAYAERAGEIVSDDPVARAEAALGKLAGEFTAWMYDESERLEAAREDVVRHGLTQKTHGPLFRAAHDIKGEAATFGYPALAGVADSLCRLLEHTPQLSRIPIALVNQHVAAVRAIFREYDRPDLSEMAAALSNRLREVTEEFLEHENSFRPDYLESTLAPPLVPKTSGR